MLAGTGSAATTAGQAPAETEVVTASSKAWAAERREERKATRCQDARRGLTYYRLRWQSWHALRGVQISIASLAIPKACPYTRYLAVRWKKRAHLSRQRYERWYREKFYLRDYVHRDGNHAWARAVAEVQRLYPGTMVWLMTCSSAEGGHGRWVGYSGVPYSSWLRDSNTVGGHMQFRFGTFTGMWRRSVEHAHARGYHLPPRLLGDSLEAKTRAWRSTLGQAMAAGWARYTGNDNSHWSASWGNGC